MIFSFSLVVNDFVYALAFITTSSAKTISTGVFTELIRDIFFWQALMAATLIPTIPLALLYNIFLDRFIARVHGRRLPVAERWHDRVPRKGARWLTRSASTSATSTSSPGETWSSGSVPG